MMHCPPCPEGGTEGGARGPDCDCDCDCDCDWVDREGMDGWMNEGK